MKSCEPTGVSQIPGVTVWISQGLTPARVARMATRLSDSSTERLLQLNDAGRRTDFLQIRALLMYAVRRQNLRVGACALDDDGPAPRLEQAGTLSLSHSLGLRAVVTYPKAVGVDVERRDRVLAVDRLAARLLPVEEAEWISAARHARSRQRRFLRIWTAREAAFKAGLIPLVTAGPAWVQQGCWSAPYPCRQRITQRYVLSVVSAAALPPLRVIRVGAALV